MKSSAASSQATESKADPRSIEAFCVSTDVLRYTSYMIALYYGIFIDSMAPGRHGMFNLSMNAQERIVVANAAPGRGIASLCHGVMSHFEPSCHHGNCL